MKLDPALQLPHITVNNQDELLELLGQKAIDADLAHADYISALKQREQQFPTGLAISGGVAIPHTAAEHVKGSTVIVATLNSPINFGELGGDSEATIEVNTVLLLLLDDATSHVAILSALVKKLQNVDFVTELRAATTGTEIVKILTAHL